jgi:hypothetical protein
MIQLDYPWAGKLYKGLVAAGLLMLLLAVFFMSREWAGFEKRAGVVYEVMTLSAIEVDSLNRELGALQRVIEGQSPGPGTGEYAVEGEVEYSEAEVAQLILEIGNLQQQLAARAQRYAEAQATRDALFSRLLVSIALTCLALSAAVLMLIIGGLGWHYRIKIFEDRRRQPRESEPGPGNGAP